jgi:shikimate dehydrogenase
MRSPVSSISIANRNWDRAASLVADVRRAFPRRAVEAIPLDGTAAARMREATLLVQATTVGSGAQRTETPVAPDALHPGLVVLDMVYEPRETVLLRDARARGCRTLEGRSMLVYQGARAFELWTGRPAPMDEMRRAVGLAGDTPAARVGGR